MAKIRHRARLVLNRRTAAITLFTFATVLGMGARCIQGTSVHVDKDGYTHITGEMANDTDVQGTQIMLRGTLYDDAGNVVATKDSPTCPPDTQPHSLIMFDIRFDNPNVPPYARYNVRPISGKAQAERLPDPDVVVLQTDAIRFEGVPNLPGLPITDDDVLLQFGVRNRSGETIVGVQGCAAVYDQHGDVVAAFTSELTSVDESGFPHPAVFGSEGPAVAYLIVKDVPTQPTQIRAWLWFGPKGAATSAWQFFSTPLITIQKRTF